ncbi:MAG: DUF308 domain-containing protein [Clostridia bacterium]|nr:DUF308 domain-containing protein [Clostridia bacterium]
MNIVQRIKNVLLGVLIILSSVIIMAFPDVGLIIVAAILCFSLFIYGIKSLIFYYSMARHMVGGRIILYLGIIILDFGMFALMLTDIPRFYIVLYLLVIYAFSGVIDILRSLEAKKYQASSWKLFLASGVINIVVAVLCIVFIKRGDMIVYFYGAGLIYSAAVRIISAFRKTAIVYIQ